MAEVLANELVGAAESQPPCLVGLRRWIVTLELSAVDEPLCGFVRVGSELVEHFGGQRRVDA